MTHQDDLATLLQQSRLPKTLHDEHRPDRTDLVGEDFLVEIRRIQRFFGKVPCRHYHDILLFISQTRNDRGAGLCLSYVYAGNPSNPEAVIGRLGASWQIMSTTIFFEMSYRLTCSRHVVACFVVLLGELFAETTRGAYDEDVLMRHHGYWQGVGIMKKLFR